MLRVGGPGCRWRHLAGRSQAHAHHVAALWRRGPVDDFNAVRKGSILPAAALPGPGWLPFQGKAGKELRALRVGAVELGVLAGRGPASGGEAWASAAGPCRGDTGPAGERVSVKVAP